MGSDNNLYAVYRDGSNHAQITTTGDIWSFTLSPDGRYYAYATIYANDNNIYVGDLEAGTETPYPVVPQDYQEPGSSSTNTVLYADALAFDYTSNTIVFDALNCLSMPGDLCSDGDGYRYWSIGFLNISDGSFSFPFPNQSPAFDIGYPSFAYNNNYVVVFDVLDYSSSATDSSMVWTYDSETQESKQVASPNLSSSTQYRWGVPSFWGGDDYVTMQRFSGTGGKVYRVPVDSSWAGDEGAAQLLNDYDAAMPIMHRAAERVLTATIQASASLLDFGNVSLGSSSTLDLTLTNTGNRDINISNVQITDSSAFTHNGTNALLGRGKDMTFGVAFSPGQQSGTQTGTLTITSDADSPSISVSLTATGQSAPTAPSDLSATATSSSTIVLSWTDNSLVESAFEVERKTGSEGTYSQIATVDANVTTYSDTGLSESTTYYYRVRAYNSAGNSTYSDEADATTLATRPTVSSTTPANNATDVVTSTTITATFSQAMDSSTITADTFLVNDGTINIAGTVTTVTQSGTVATFSPTTALDYSTTYTAIITTGAKDLAGNALEADYTWSFTTESQTPTDGEPPSDGEESGGGGGGGGGGCFISVM